MRKIGNTLIIAAVFLLTVPHVFGAEEKNTAEKPTPKDTYKSKHGFSIGYPKSWKLVTYMEDYGTLREAEKDAGNYFSIQSYQDDDPRIRGYHYFPADTLKLEAWVYPDYGGTLTQFITQTKDITRIDDFTIGGKKAKRVWQKVKEGVDAGDEIYSIYFVDDGKRAIFTCYPFYTSLKDKFEEIVGSFRFE